MLFRSRNVAGGFDLSFRFRITDRDRSYGGADGIAFVIQNSGTGAIGADGGAGGFAPARPQDAQRPGIELSLSVFFDMYHNSEDPSDNYIVVSANGKLKEMRWPPRRIAESKKLKVHMKDGKERWHKQICDPDQLYYASAAPLIVGNHVIAGVSGDDLDVPGYIQAHDPETGEHRGQQGDARPVDAALLALGAQRPALLVDLGHRLHGHRVGDDVLHHVAHRREQGGDHVPLLGGHYRAHRVRVAEQADHDEIGRAHV